MAWRRRSYRYVQIGKDSGRGRPGEPQLVQHTQLDRAYEREPE